MRLGLFGGTFNPVHRGHMAAGRAAVDVLSLDQLLFIPSGHPPLKGNSGLAAGHHRVAMLQIAMGDFSCFGLCDYEVEREGKSYSVDTVRHIASQTNDGDELIFLLGSDCVDRLPQWKGIDEIKSLASFAIISRNGANLSALAPDFLTVPMEAVAASSTAVRRLLNEGNIMPSHVDERVSAYIRENNLYISAVQEAAYG